VALRTTCIKNVKFKIINIKTDWQYVRYFYTTVQRRPKLGRIKPSTGPRVGHSCSRV